MFCYIPIYVGIPHKYFHMAQYSIIIELQELASDKNNDLTDLLRKSLIVATKLNVEDFKSWIRNELYGYKTTEVPSYRKIRADLKLHNPYNGLIPFMIRNHDIENAIKNVELCDSIENLTHLINDASNGFVIYKTEDSMQRIIMDLQPETDFYAVRKLGVNQLVTIIDSVRNTILEWSLKLEEEGILGEGISFSQEEKQIAMSNSNINIKQFQGVIGNVSNSNLNQNLNISITKNNFEELSNYLQENNINEKDVKDLKTAISNDVVPTSNGTFGDNVSSWIGKMISKASNGSWEISIGAAGGLLANAISKYYGF